MDIFDQFNIEENCSKQELSQQLIEVRKKLNFQKNSANAEKRMNAELLEEQLQNLQMYCDDASEDFSRFKLMMETQTIITQLPDSSEYTHLIVNNNYDAILYLIRFLILNNEYELSQKWCSYAYEDLGEITVTPHLADTYFHLEDPVSADKWYKFAEDNDVLQNYSCWAFIQFTYFHDLQECIRLLEKGAAVGDEECILKLCDIYLGEFSADYIDTNKARHYADIINENNPYRAQQIYNDIAAMEHNFAPDSNFSLFLEDLLSKTRSAENSNANNYSSFQRDPILIYKKGVTLTETQKRNYLNSLEGKSYNNKAIGGKPGAKKILSYILLLVLAYLLISCCVSLSTMTYR